MNYIPIHTNYYSSHTNMGALLSLFFRDEDLDNLQGYQDTDFDELSKDEILEYIKEMASTVPQLNDKFKDIMSEYEIQNTKLIPICLEILDIIVDEAENASSDTSSNDSNGSNDSNDKQKKKKFKRYVVPQFSTKDIVEKVKESQKIYLERKFNEEKLELYTIPEPKEIFNDDDISLKEYNEAFTDVLTKKDMMGMTKKILSDLPDYHKNRLINAFNEILTGGEGASDISFGRASYIYKDAKKGPKDKIKSYREIVTIPNSINHFHRVLSLRLREYFSENNYLDTTIQKGGISGQKVPIMQQIIKIKSIIKHANDKKGKAVVLFLDVANAFGSLSREALFNILKKYHVSPNFIDYLDEYYKNFTYYAGNRNLKSDDMLPWTTGIIQGCPLSSLLFVIALNYVLRHLDDKYKEPYGYEVLPAAKVLFSSFMDDMALVSNSVEGATKVYTELKQLCAEMGLEFNPTKCILMLVGFTDEEKKQIDIDGIPQDGYYKYLGAHITHDGKTDDAFGKFLKMLGGRMHYIDKSDFENDLKFDSFRGAILPWIKRQMANMYDLTKEQRVKVIHIVRTYMDKWGNTDTIELFTTVQDLVKDVDDDVINNIELADYDNDVNFDTDLSGYKCLTKLSYSYDDVKADAKVEKDMEKKIEN